MVAQPFNPYLGKQRQPDLSWRPAWSTLEFQAELYSETLPRKNKNKNNNKKKQKKRIVEKNREKPSKWKQSNSQ